MACQIDHSEEPGKIGIKFTGSPLGLQISCLNLSLGRLGRARLLRKTFGSLGLRCGRRRRGFGSRAMPSDLRPFIDEIEANARTATDAARQREGCADMGYADHVLRLVASGRPFLPRENPLWLTSRTRHIRRIGKLAFSALMEPRVIDIPLSRRRPRWVQPVTATAHSKVTPLQHGMQVDRGVTWLTGVVFLPEPPRQRRQANAKILRDLLPRPSSVWCKPPASRRNSGAFCSRFPQTSSGPSDGAIHFFQASPS